MRNKNSSENGFGVALIDIISGALGIMTILFFIVIVEASNQRSVSEESLKPILDDDFLFIKYEIFHDSIGTVFLPDIINSAGVEGPLKSDYYLDEDQKIALYSYTAMIPPGIDTEDLNRVRLSHGSLLEGSKLYLYKSGVDSVIESKIFIQ